MVFRRFSSLSRGDSDRLSVSAILKSCHKGMWVFATLLYHVIQLSGGLGQALKQLARDSNQCFDSQKGSYLLRKRSNLWGFHGFVGQDRKILDWRDTAEGCLTPEVQKFRNMRLMSYFRVSVSEA